MFRALESARPQGARLFEDPFAYGFLPMSLRAVVQLSRVPIVGRVVPWLIDRRWPGPRGAAVVRTRFIDDALAEALRLGIDQVVIVGAGFDSRACRISGIERARVYEVDHPATQHRKQERLRRTLGALPAHVAFVASDVGREPLADTLARAGVRATARTFFILEGITNYLTAEAIDATLRYVASTAAGSRVVFTYLDRAMLDGTVRFEGGEASMTIVRRSGEPFIFGFVPAELPAYLAARGLTLREHLGAADYRRRYLAPRHRRDMVAEFYWAALAEVGAAAPAR